MATRRAQGHARRAHYCSCGFVIHGNGARSSHERMHQQRKGDGHRWWSTTQWEALGRPFVNHPVPELRRPVRP
jgi:hypothetical protein